MVKTVCWEVEGLKRDLQVTEIENSHSISENFLCNGLTCGFARFLLLGTDHAGSKICTDLTNQKRLELQGKMDTGGCNTCHSFLVLPMLLC